MCLIVFAWDIHPKYRLIMAANRDEFYDRPTRPAGYWEDHPDILGGRDEMAGGTWLAVHRSGRMGAVTNFRDPKRIRPDAQSRGAIPVEFLLSDLSVEHFVSVLDNDSESYNGFNFLGFDGEQLVHYSNYEKKTNLLKPGIYGISNALLDTPWPKLVKAKVKFSQIISGPFEHSGLLMAMSDGEIAADNLLPDTGVPKEWERALSAICIRTENYGTRSSTILTLERSGRMDFTERTYPINSAISGTIHFDFNVM